jgi:hypothetical protein
MIGVDAHLARVSSFSVRNKERQSDAFFPVLRYKTLQKNQEKVSCSMTIFVT